MCRRALHRKIRSLIVPLIAAAALGCGPDPSARRDDPSPPSAAVPARDSGATTATAESEPEDSRPPRLVILISIDTLRADHLGLYGYERPTSPRLDALAAEGVVFEDASSTAPWTLPAHASLLTGLYPKAHRVLKGQSGLPANVRTLASMLAARGYETAAVVNSSWLRKEKHGLTREFDRYLWVQESANRRAPSTWVTDQAIEWIDRAGSRRLFVFMHYYDVHADYTSEPRYEELFVTPYEGAADGTARQLGQSELLEGVIEWCEKNVRDDLCSRAAESAKEFENLQFDEDAVRYLEQLYDAGIRQIDAELNRLFVHLRTKDLLDETMLVITSDHGEEFMEHGRVSHFYTTYQEVLHVPLILRGPGIPAGVRISTPVSIVDIVPTVLSRVGAAVPPSLDGLDLSRLWRSDASSEFEGRLLFGEASGGALWGGAAAGVPVYRSVRQGRHKLVQGETPERLALYDLDRDPGEQVDLSSREPELAARLEERLRERVEPAAEAPPAPLVELDAEDLERLRALGYVP